MRAKTIIRTLCCLFVVAATCGTVFAQGKIRSGSYNGPMMPMAATPDAPDAAPFYSNFVVDPCTACNYSADNGFLLLGPNNCGIPGSTQWLAAPFVAARSGAVKRVTLAVTDWSICTPTTHQFTVAIYSDNCTGLPNTQIGTAVNANAPAAPCQTAAANFAHAGVTLTAGTTYWVVLTTSAAAQQMATTAVWWEANSALEPFNLNDGNGWQPGPLGGPGAFSVQ
jgi:hypothetical protein